MSKNSPPIEHIIPIQVERSNTVKNDDGDNAIQANSQGSDTTAWKGIQTETEQDKSQASDNDSEQITTPSLLDSPDDLVEPVEETPPDRTLPIFNTREKIILVLDRAEDDNFTPFKVSHSESSSPLTMLKRGLEMFLKWKLSISKRHEFALVVLDENTASWCLDFTSSVDTVLNKLKEVTTCEAEDIFNLNSLFDVLHNRVKLPVSNSLSVPPLYVVRTILLYSRSYTIPQLKTTEEIERLLNSPYYTLDVLMTHEPIDSDNNCNKIFTALQQLDRKGFSYFLPVSRNARNLYSSMGLLLSHPMQRPFKKFAEYHIKDISG